MLPSKLHTYTLAEIASFHTEKPLNENILVFDITSDNVHNLRLNYPCKGDFISLIIVLSGTAKVKVDFEGATLTKGSLMTTLPNNITEFESTSPDCHIHGILVSTKYMSELRFQLNSSEAMNFMSNTYSKFLLLDQETFTTMTYLMDRILKNNRKDTFYYFHDGLIESYVTLLFFELANYAKIYYDMQEERTISSTRQENIAVHFVRLVGENFREHREVQFYAEQLHVSRKHLTKVITSVYGLSPKQIIDRKVIAETKILLQQSEMNIKEIMRKLNFEDQAVFSKYFKKHTGYSPLIYRNRIINF